MPLPVPVCVSFFQLNATLLTQFCYLFDPKLNNGYNVNITEVEVFLLTHCCPSLINGTKKPSKKEQLKNICNFLEDDDHTVNETCRSIHVVSAEVNTRADLGFVEITYLALIIPLGILANILVIFTTHRSVRSNNAVPMTLIHNLGIADLLTLTGFVLVLILYRSQVIVESTPVGRFLFSSFDIFTASASLTFVMAISIDRAFAVLYPFKHFSGATKKKAKVVAGVLWTICSSLCLLSLLRIWIDNSDYRTYFLFTAITIACFVPCFLVIVSYIIIIIITITSNRKIVRANARRFSITSNGVIRYREIKLAISVSTIIVPFVVGWGYVAVVTVYENVQSSKLHGLYISFLQIAPLTVSSLNPMIYLLMTSSLRKNSLKMIHECCFCRRLKLGERLRNSFSRGSSRTDGSKESGLNEEHHIFQEEQNI